MSKRYIYILLSIICYSYPPFLFANETCHNITDIIGHNEIASYKALGKIKFFKQCKNDELCDSGSYIIKGDYFIAVQLRNYLCAAYFSNNKNHVNTIGIITDKNFLKTPVDEYSFLMGSWINHFYNITKHVEIFSSEKGVGINGEAETKIGDYKNYFDGTVLKVGKAKFIGVTVDGLYQIAVDKGTLLIKNDIDTDDTNKDYNFFGIFTKINE